MTLDGGNGFITVIENIETEKKKYKAPAGRKTEKGTIKVLQMAAVDIALKNLLLPLMRALSRGACRRQGT